MPQQGLIYRILVASPSDCIQERKAVPEVVYSWNAANSFQASAIIDPVMWETHAIPELGDRPQAIINKQLVEKCDILIGTFWTRLGTRTGEAESGTVEEIEKFRAAGKPVLLYFSSVPVVPESIDRKQYEALSKYKKQLEKKGIVFRYDSIGDFREQFQRHLSSTMTSLLSSSDATSLDTLTEPEDDTIEQVQMFKTQFESFLRKFEAEWTAEKESEPINIEDGIYIIEDAFSEIIDFLSMIVKDDETDLSKLLKEASKKLKALIRHRLYADGGASYNAFWKEGDEIIDLIKKVPLELERILGENER